MVEKDCSHVFVYGTLKGGQPNHDEMVKEGVIFEGRGVTELTYPLVVGSQWNFPFLIFQEGKGKNIKGEIYRLTSEQLSWLDSFEGHPDLYERDRITVNMTEEQNCQPVKRSISCWCYFMKKFDQELLEKPFLDNYDNASYGEDMKYNSEEDIHDRGQL